MAANSLLYLLLASGLSTPPTPPNGPVTTESHFDAAYTSESYDHTKDPDDRRPLWDRYRSENPRDRLTDEPVTEDYGYTDKEDIWPHWAKPEYKTEDPSDQYPVTRNQYPATRDVVTRLDYDHTEEADQIPTRRPGYKDKLRASKRIWPQEPEYKTEDPSYQYPATRNNEESCPPWEIYSDCDAGCQPTCENVGKPVICPRMCIPGCVCDEPGTVRGPDGNCIAPPLCPSGPSAVDVVTRLDDDHTEEEYQMPTKRPGYEDNTEDSRIFWPQESEYKTEDPRDQYPVTRNQYPVTRNQYPVTRNQYPVTRNQYPVSRNQYPVTRNQYPATRNQYPVTRDVVTRLDDDHTEEADQFPTRRPGYEDKTQDPSDQYPVTRDVVTRLDDDHTEDADQFPTRRPGYEDKTQDPSNQYPVTREDNAEIIWPWATEEPEHETDRPENSAMKTHRKKRCPKLEHRSFQCEKTCSNYKKKEPCPKQAKKNCVCDGGYVRNKQGKCVPRDECEASEVDPDSPVTRTWNLEPFTVKRKKMAEEDETHGCPYVYACDMYCVSHGKEEGKCNGNVCKCVGK